MDDDLAHPRPNFVTFDFHGIPRGCCRICGSLPAAADPELQQPWILKGVGSSTGLDRQERWIANSLELQQIKPPLVTLC